MKARCLADGKDYAVKIINKEELGPEYEQNLKTEVAILKKVEHPSIIKLKDIYESDDSLFLVMEL